MLKSTNNAGLTAASIIMCCESVNIKFTANIDFFNQAEKQCLIPRFFRFINGQELIYLLH